MPVYTVRTGENIYDVAMNLYGNIEGIFDLLVSNQEAINGYPLTMDTELKSGMKLNYHEQFVINQDIKEWLTDHKEIARNGDHRYGYQDTLTAVKEYIDKHNAELVKRAMEQWPSVYDGENFSENPDIVEEEAFYRYMHAFYIGSGASDIEIATNNYIYVIHGDGILESYIPSYDEIKEWEKSIVSPRLIIKQEGELCSITTRVRFNTILGIDWGDGSPYEFHGYSQSQFTAEHNYDGSGKHTVRLFGNFQLYNLNLLGASGRHYPLDSITIIGGEVRSHYEADSKINSLFIFTEETE